MGLSQSSLKSESLEYLVAFRNCYMLDTTTPTESLPTSNYVCSTPRKCPTCHLAYSQRLFTFPATLMTCELRAVCKGQLELCTHQLIFSNGIGHNLNWPLETIRWFGENASFFVFESGRKSPSGPGLFVFQCKRSKSLSKKMDKQIKQLTPFHAPATSSSTHLINSKSKGSASQRARLRFNVTHPSRMRDRRTLSCSVTGQPVESTLTASDADSDPGQTDDTLLSSRSQSLTESSCTISYPVLFVQPNHDQVEPVTGPVSEETQPENYRSLETATTSLYSSSSSSGSAGQYLIAAALHRYVNQPTGLLVSQQQSSEVPLRPVPEYVEEPV